LEQALTLITYAQNGDEISDYSDVTGTYTGIASLSFSPP
jgi:hypothetical protein